MNLNRRGERKVRRRTGSNKNKVAYLSKKDMNKIENHIKKYLGDFDLVIHEEKSTDVHLDVIPLILDDRFPFNMLITMGMSAKPMNVPDEAEASAYAELVMLLPKDWKLDQKYWTENKYFWPISVIKHSAKFPHKNNTFFGFGHTINNGGKTNDPEPYAENTDLNYMFIDKPRMLPDGFNHLKINDEKIIDFLCLVPIYPEEYEFKRILGANALVIAFEDNEVSQIVDIHREKWCEGSSDVLGDSFSFEEEYPEPNEESKKNLEKSVNFLHQGKYEEALQLFEGSLDEHDFGHFVFPDEIRKFLLVATEIILKDRENEDKKISNDFSDKIHYYWFELADHHIVDYDEFKQAAECADEALKLSKNMDNKQGELAAMAYGHTEQYEKVIYVCDLVLKDDPEDDILLENKVDALRELGKYKESLKNLEKLRDPSSFYNPFLEDQRLALLNLNKRYEETIVEVEKRLKKHPNFRDNLYEKAFALYKLVKIKEAVTTLKKSIQRTHGKIQKDMRRANSLYFLGYIYATELGNCKEALQFLNEAIDIDDTNPKITKTKEIIEKKIKNKDEEKIGKKDLPEYEHFFWF